MTKEDTTNTQSAQAFWCSFGDQEIPEELLKPRSKLLVRISSHIRGNKAEAPVNDDRVHVAVCRKDADNTMSPELDFYFRLADRILDRDQR